MAPPRGGRQVRSSGPESNPRLGLDNSVARTFDGCKLSFYTPEEIDNIASCTVKYADPYDQLGNPIEGGLHDMRMGGWKDKADVQCPTCGLTWRQGCTGHYGRIKLCAPVYNPFLMLQVFKLLKCTCSECHKFRMGEKDKARLLGKFRYLQRGKMWPERAFDEIKPGIDKEGGQSGHGIGWNDDDKDGETDMPLRIEDHSKCTDKKHIANYETRSDTFKALDAESHRVLAENLKKEIKEKDDKLKERVKKDTQRMRGELLSQNGGQANGANGKLANGANGNNVNGNSTGSTNNIPGTSDAGLAVNADGSLPMAQGSGDFSTALIEAWRKLTAEFERNQPVGKCSCGQPNDQYRKRDWSVFFKRPHGKNVADGNEILVLPYMVKEQLKKVWENEKDLFECLFPGTKGGNIDMFFVQDLLVTPNHFRSPKK